MDLIGYWPLALCVGNDRNTPVAEHRPQAFSGRRMRAAAIGSTAINDRLQATPPCSRDMVHWMVRRSPVSDPAPTPRAKHRLVDGDLLKSSHKDLERQCVIVDASLGFRDADAAPAAVASSSHHPIGGGTQN